jgi:hypothetical protein
MSSAPTRFFFVTVGVVVLCWLVGSAIGLSMATLQQTVIVFAFVGLIIASALETILKRKSRNAVSTPGAPPKPESEKT